jgi:acyl transferase domain-containing protein
VLALEHEELPPQLHFRRPTPEISWETMPIEVVAKPVAWPRRATPRRAGVSSFGFSGANAHVVLTEAPASAVAADALNRPRHILAFSARDSEALAELARRYASALRERPEAQLADFCYTANTGRAQFRYRTAVSGESSEQFAAVLARFADPDESSLARGLWSGEPPKVAFLFTGQGSQYFGMGRRLYDTQPTFRTELDHCAEALASHLDRPLLDLLFAPSDRAGELDQTCYTQPALFALEWALVGCGAGRDAGPQRRRIRGRLPVRCDESRRRPPVDLGSGPIDAVAAARRYDGRRRRR